MILPFFEKRFLAIDLGSLNIKAIEATVKKNEVEVLNFGMIPILNFKDFETPSYILEENLSAILSSFFKEAKIKSRNALYNITAPYIFPVNFLVPNIPERNLPQIIRFESQKQISLSLEEIELEYRYIQFETEGEKKWLVFFSAVPKNYLKKLDNLSELTKIKNVGYSLEYFNFEPYFQRRTGNFLVVDLGHSYSTINLIKEGRVIYGNKLKFRGYDLLDSLMKIMQMSEEDSLTTLKKRGFLFTPEERDLKNLVDNFLNNIATSLQAEIEKLENSFLLRVEKIYFTGGISILPGFKEGLTHRLPSFQQEILNPSDFVLGEKFKSLGEKSTIFSQALGILLRKIFG